MVQGRIKTRFLGFLVSKIRVGRGRSAVTIDGPLAADLSQEIDGILGPVMDDLRREAQQILDDAQKKWPVKTGKSKDSFELVTTVIPGTFEVEVSILSDLKYVRYIKPTKGGKDDNATRIRSPLQAHLLKPARKGKMERIKRLTEVLAAAIQHEIGEAR